VPKTQWMQDELRLRTRMIGAGVWLSVVLLVGVGAWIAATWSHPHRGGLVAMAAAAASATAIIAVLPRERIVASRFREAYFLGWSLALIIFISVAAGLDTGVRSPMVLTLFLTLVYAALSYPRWSVTVVSAASLVAVLALSELGTTHGALPTSPVYLIGLMTTLAVTGVMCICQARIQEQIRSELGRLSRSDPLTGCLNRLGFTERMATELARARLSPVALVVIDFDGFKAVNDRHGHSAGDDLLCWAAAAMGSALRPADALARLGGDEFAALLPDTDAARAQQVAERLRMALSPRISACVGVASSDADGLDADRLYRRADEHLYERKRCRPDPTAARHSPIDVQIA
jgi:diguanylate cyclase (GGDEF)-like protein